MKIQQENKKNKKTAPFIIAGILLVIIAVILLIVKPFDKKNDESVSGSTEKEFMFKKQGELTFTNADKQVLAKVDIEIAKDDYSRELGLMFRKSMEENQAMLFIFPMDQKLSFWMRNTYIPLDMMFVNSANKIITIHKNTQTLSDQSYAATENGKYVVETVAGYTDKHNIKVGDYINYIESK
jgi:uncharacterized membrane protein (UPF0127 family)